MALYEEYEAFAKKYQKEYGPHTVVLYRCGQFYEIYSANDGVIDIKSIAELLNIQISRRNKAILEVNRSNTLMAGFPMFALRKFVNLLVNNNYTVVVVDQVSDPPRPKRAVTEVISPGTLVEDGDAAVAQDTPHLMCIYIEDITDRKSKTNNLCIGCSVIDISTGISKVYETASNIDDSNFSLDEIYRLILSHNPREFIIFGQVSSTTFESVISYLELEGKCVHNKVNQFPPELLTMAYQTQLLQKVFPKHGMLSVIEYLDLERKPFALLSYIYLLQFTAKHNELILSNIEKPVVLEDNHLLLLQYNAIRQLNIVASSDQKHNSLLHITNNCSSAIGRRYYKDALLNPIINIDILQKRYNAIDEAIKGRFYEEVGRHLARAYDIERLTRKMSIGRFHPSDLVQVNDTMMAVLGIIEAHNDFCQKYFDQTAEGFDMYRDMQHYYDTPIDMDEVAKYHLDNIDGSFFRRGYNDEVDKLQDGVDANMNVFTTLTERLNELNEGYFKLDSNERDGYHFIITTKRYNEVKARMKESIVIEGHTFKPREFQVKPVSATSTSYKVTCKAFEKITDTILNIKNKLRVLLLSVFKTFISEFFTKYEKTLKDIVGFIGNIDICMCNAANAVKFKYYRPVIDSTKSEAFVDARQIRHPIIERVNIDIEYVTNDVKLGTNEEANMHTKTSPTDGILLFGLNCSGKTSLSKALALNIIMAQSGSFVPSQMVYSPFRSIFTRIPSGDDIFKSMSTFAVEMSELRNILNRADKNSLIVGDEISHGTEVRSGVAIVGASVIELAKRKCKFIFATHLHNIVNVEDVMNLPNIKLMHLSVQYDEASRKLVYDRKLKDGSGSSVYGLEVCKALDMPRGFLELANNIRCQQSGIEPHIVGLNKSRYNKDVFIDTCSICGKRTEEVHHIKQQCEADEHGYIGHVHKNVKSNLVNVCSACHDSIHAGDLMIHGYVQTSDGKELSWEKSPPKANAMGQCINMGSTDGNDGVDFHPEVQIMECKKKGMSIAAIVKYLHDKGLTEYNWYRVNKVTKNAWK